MIGKDKFDGADVFEGIFKRHSRETAKKYVDLDMKAILKEVEEYLQVIHNSDFSIIEKSCGNKNMLDISTSERMKKPIELNYCS